MPKKSTRDRRHGERRTGQKKAVKLERRRGPTRTRQRRTRPEESGEFELREPRSGH